MRDPEIQKAFEVADDSLQAIQLYHLYAIAAQTSSDKGKISDSFPERGIQITPIWGRFYDKREVVDFFSSDLFELIQSRVSLVYVTSVFDDVLSRFIKHLTDKGFPQDCRATVSYYKRIVWAYRKCKRCPLSAVNDETIKRLPVTFGIIDDARRLRNLIVHNHGLFSKEYESTAIRSDGIEVQVHPDYEAFKKNPAQSVPAIFTTKYLLKFVWCHIEALHVTHNSIQEEYFHVTDGYSYEAEKKSLELKRMLFGDSELDLNQGR